MSDKALFEELTRALDGSDNFRKLPPERREDIKNRFAEADDVCLRKALEAVKADGVKSVERERQAQLEAATELKQEIMAIQKDEIEDNRHKDAEDSEKAAEEALKGLGEAQKKKKIFGIF